MEYISVIILTTFSLVSDNINSVACLLLHQPHHIFSAFISWREEKRRRKAPARMEMEDGWHWLGSTSQDAKVGKEDGLVNQPAVIDQTSTSSPALR